ncbi:hypothetical protein Tco_0870791 [Tanacetum coccineum]
MAGGVRIEKGTALRSDEVIPQHTTQPLPADTPIPDKFDYQKVVEYENERVLAAERKAQAAKEKAVGKRQATGEGSGRTKKKKVAPLTFSLDESDGNESNRSGFGTHHYASPLTTIIPGVHRPEDDEEHDHGEDEEDTEVNSLRPSNQSGGDTHVHSGGDTHAHSGDDTHIYSSGGGLFRGESTEQLQRRAFVSSGMSCDEFVFRGSGRQAFPKRNAGADGAGSSLRKDTAQPTLFVPAWNLTT